MQKYTQVVEYHEKCTQIVVHHAIFWKSETYLEKVMATHSSTLAWRIPWLGEPGGLLSMWSHRVGLKRLSMHACIEEGNGNPLQYSCLENPRDRGAWGGCRLWGRTELDTTKVT